MSDRERLRPLHDQIVVRVEREDDRLPSGLVRPESAQRGETGVGIVVAVGPGRVDRKTGERSEMELTVGDRVAYEVFRAIHKAELPTLAGEVERFAVIEQRHVIGVLEGDGEIEVRA